MTGSLATFGYSNKNTEHELQCALRVNPQALIIDIRLKTLCNWSSLWTQSSLQARFGDRSIWRGDWLGNVNFRQPDAPIQLVDEAQGIPWIVRGLEQGYTLILLCACFHYSVCHRKVIYDKTKSVLQDRLPEYGLGQRVLTPCGAGHIDPSIPLDVHRARNRYAVNLDIANPKRSFFRVSGFYGVHKL